MSEIVSVKTVEQLQDVLARNPVVVVEFFRSIGCVYCDRLAPHFQAAAEKSDLPFVKVDAQAAALHGFVAQAEIFSVPQIFVYENGEKGREIKGRTSVQILKELG